MLSIQRSAGNRAARMLLGSTHVSVQRKPPSLSGLMNTVGAGKKKKKPGPVAQAEQAGLKAKSAKVLTVNDLKKQVDTLASATQKLVKAHQPGDGASQRAAFEVHRAATHILGNLPDHRSKASRVLGAAYSEEMRRLQRVIDDTQLILDEVRVANSQRQAQDIYRDAGRTATRGQAGALTNLSIRSAFDTALVRPTPDPKVTAYLQQNGFATYEEAFEAALAKTAANPRAEDERRLQGLQPGLFQYTERARSRNVAASMGVTPAELAAIQTYTAQDYRYINPATSNDPAWLRANFPDLVDKPNMTTEDWAELQDQLADTGQTMKQRMADRQGQLTGLREEGALHTGVAVQGLAKMPVWKGTAYRGEDIDAKRFYPRFVRDGKGFRPRQPTFAWKSITSISKSEDLARGFMFMNTGVTHRIMWEFEVTNGRDIEAMSVNRSEREIALLPGAEFAYGDIQVVREGRYVDGFGQVPWELRIKARQIK